MKTLSLLCPNPLWSFYHSCTCFLSACVVLFPIASICDSSRYTDLGLLKMLCLSHLLPQLPKLYPVISPLRQKQKQKQVCLKANLLGGLLFISVLQGCPRNGHHFGVVPTYSAEPSVNKTHVLFLSIDCGKLLMRP